MSSLLSIGASGLAAAQGTLGTIGHNIANVNTPGYSRQQTVLASTSGNVTGAGFFGRGVDITTVRRQYDQFLGTAIQLNASRAASDASRADALAGLDSVFADGRLGVGAAADALFAAAGDLANRPGDTTARQAFLARADQLAQRVGAVGTQLAELGQLAESRIAQAATDVNARLSEIKALNVQIFQAQASGHTPNDLLDQRDVALQALNGLMSVSSVAAADGTVNLFTATGAALLVGSQQAQLKAVPDPADGARSALQLVQGPSAQWLDGASLNGGALAGLLRFRDQDLSSTVNQLGRLAQVVADRFNTQQSLGVNAAGNPGAALFSVAGPVSIPHSANAGAGTVSAMVVDSAALGTSDYRVDWDGSAFAITRLTDGQVTSAAGLPVVVDGLSFAASGAMAAGNSYLVRPFAAAATALSAKPLAPGQVATGFAATVEAGAANKGLQAARAFAVVRQTPDTALPVTITFNDPPTTFNVTGLAGGDLSNVPYVPGQSVPPSPADYNGWRLVLDGTAVAGDRFAVRANTSPASDNRNALALGGLADLPLVGGATLNASYAALVGEVGARVQGARDAANVSSRLQAEAVTRQQAVSGVNLDEEAANLLRYQQAYQASAKIIQTSQTLFEALLSAAGR